jgi:hypothetical protein
MGHNAANGTWDNEPEGDPEPFSENRCPLGDGSLSLLLSLNLSDSVVRHTLAASKSTTVTLKATGITGFMPFVTDTF